MNNSITLVAALALAVGTSFVVAQTTPTQSSPTGTGTQPNSTPAPTGTGNPTGSPMTSPRTNMPTTGAMSSTTPPDFNTLDKNRAGFLTQKDIASNPWM